MIRPIDCRETIYYSVIPGTDELGQWLILRIDSSEPHVRSARITVEHGKDRTFTDIDLIPGRREYRCYATGGENGPTQPSIALVSLEVSGERFHLSCRVGSYRPWTIYLLSDTCSDYTWGYSNELRYKADDVALTEAELAALEATISDLPEHRNRYNFVVANEVEFYRESHFDVEAERLFARIRDGYFSVSPFPTMSISGAQSIEELARQFYLAREWERDYGISIKYANHQETPSITWAAASMLASCGISYLVKGLLPFDTPWASRLAEPPIFLWEGPDGSRVRYRRYNHSYDEGHFILQELREINNVIERRIVPKYESYGPEYPFRSIGVVGVYSDLSSGTAAFAQIKANHVAAYNNQGWVYPRIVNASHQIFWEAIEREIAQGIDLPVFRGDYGTSWEIWLPTVADLFARWRRAQLLGPSADKAHAVAARLYPTWARSTRQRIREGWRALINLSDHAWNGAESENRRLNLSLRERWLNTVEDTLGGVKREGLELTAACIPPPEEGTGIVVFNTLGWARDGIVEVPVTSLPESHRGGDLMAIASDGTTRPVQRCSVDGYESVCFLATDVPSIGYRRFALTDANDTRASVVADTLPRARKNRIENQYFDIEVDPTNGSVCRLYSKVLRREMLRDDERDGLNRWTYRRGEDDQPIVKAAIISATAGPVLAELEIESECDFIRVETIVRIYRGVNRIDFINVVQKAPTDEMEQLHFAFPVDIPNCSYRFEAPGAVVSPGEITFGGEQLPGSGQAYTAVRHGACVFNDSCGMVLSQYDSGFVLFGRRSEFEDPRRPDTSTSTLLSLALGNAVNYAEVTRDQAGRDRFVFRYSIQFFSQYNSSRFVRFGWESSNALDAVVQLSPPKAEERRRNHGYRPQRKSMLLEDSGSFVTVEESQIILVNLKAGEEDPAGTVFLRLWNSAESDCSATVRIPNDWTPSAVVSADQLERPDKPLEMRNGVFSIRVPGRGFAAAIVSLQS